MSSSGYREAGIVEKLLASYGFIQCCERQARLFFHYSQYSGKVEHLKLGDPVEFEMTHDRKTGKPIASSVVKISSGAMFDEQLSQERVSGFIALEVTPDKDGRVAYENRGECFFFPFSQDDVESDIKLVAKNRVTFHISTDKSGNLRAKCLRLESAVPAPYHGIICTLKDRFGFVKRADCVKETFFHSSGCNNKIFTELSPNDCVEFDIEIRNGKEVAVNVTRLPPGSVIIEEVSPVLRRGTITKTIEKSNNNNSHGNNSTNSLSYQQNMSTPFSSLLSSPSVSSTSPSSFNKPLLQSQSLLSSPPFTATQTGQPTQTMEITYPGRISYINDAGVTVEIPFGERDVKGEYTLHISDIIEFNIATDRRDSSQHATNIKLHPSTFNASMERREQGYITAIHDSFGFIKCLNRDGTRVYFRFHELIEPSIPRLNDEVEFTAVSEAPSNRMQAIRIKHLPHGTVFKNLFSSRKNSATLATLSSLATGTLENDVSSGDGMSLAYGDSMQHISSSSNHNNHIFGNSNNHSESPFINGFGTFGSISGIDNEYPLIDLNTDASNADNLTFKNDSNRFGFNVQAYNGYNGKTQRPGIKSDSWSEILTQLPLNLNPQVNNDHLGSLNSGFRPDKAFAKLKSNQLDEQKGPRLVLIRQPRGPEPGRGFLH
ncbi:Cold shock domain-containing protein E1 [Fragariocoptes setiger]|uniref:Cold shock domain-containing protein E1 n=1 Tax=Fragariocoptes setiger TaxID=1670756 RepID=A0ABQ7S9I2_9ACAR|nr:Cold shock domain-containing protein E1 [Fragariocoptes setiger]